MAKHVNWSLIATNVLGKFKNKSFESHKPEKYLFWIKPWIRDDKSFTKDVKARRS